MVNDFNRLKWFARDGRFLRTAGRPGSGPGEFSQIRELCLLNGDSVLTIDYSSGTLTVWDSAGRHAATWSRPGFVPLGACTTDATVIVQTAMTGSAATSRTANYALKKLNGELVRDLGVLPAPSNVPPFFVEPSVVVTPELMIVAPASSYAIQVHRLDGSLVRIIRVLAEPRVITREDLRQRVSGMFPGSHLDPERAKRIERIMSLPHPATYPAYGPVRVDPLHRIWVNDYEDRRRWTLFTEDGQLLGRLTLRGDGAELAGLTPDCVMVRSRDAEGAPRLSFYPLPQVGSR